MREQSVTAAKERLKCMIHYENNILDEETMGYNGSDFAYQDGAYNQYAFTQQENGEVTMKMMKEGYERPYKKIEYIFVGK